VLGQPGFEVGLHTLGVGHQFVGLLHGKAHQADQVGQQAALLGAFDLVFAQRGVGLPQGAFVNVEWRGVQGVGQGLHVFKLERRARGPAVQDLQSGDFVFVLGNELLQSFAPVRWRGRCLR
jgi:hypothetical protein